MLMFGPGSGRKFGILLNKVIEEDTRENRDNLVEHCIKCHMEVLRLSEEARKRRFEREAKRQGDAVEAELRYSQT